MKLRKESEKDEVVTMESPLSESYATLRISEIQKRFVELMQEDNNDLRLEDSDADDGSTDPYNRRR